MKAYHHEMKHIENGDYDKQCKDVQVVEIFAHREEQGDIYYEHKTKMVLKHLVYCTLMCMLVSYYPAYNRHYSSYHKSCK